MSPIGRVFIILNLVLAAAFIGFASTNLQQQTNWKELHDTLKADLEAQVATMSAENSRLRDELSEKDTTLTRVSDLLEQSRTEVANMTAENERLSNQLDQIEGNINTIVANTQATADVTRTQAENAQQAFQNALAARQERDQAVQAQAEAVADLRDANFQISQLQEQIQALGTQVADLQRTNRQNEILLAAARQGGFIESEVQPDLRGVVSVVGPGGRLVTVSITENPGEAEITPGIRFAIYSGNTYKGEAMVSSVEGTFAFCRFEGQAQVSVGDRAATTLN